MADFKTHIGTSTVLGIGYGVAGYLSFGMTLETSILSGALCSVAGMLPDIDSDSSVPQRESLSFTAAAVPMMMVDRWNALGLTHEWIVLIGTAVYCAIRFGAGAILRRVTVHRGMWHSLPACAIAIVATFLICCCPSIEARVFKAVAVGIGYMSHLILDEVWAVKVGMLGVRVKKTFGTAIKFLGESTWGNVSTYAKLLVLTLLAIGDPVLMEKYGDYQDHEHAPHTANQWLQRTLEEGGKLFR